MQIEKIQDTCGTCIQKQIEKIPQGIRYSIMPSKLQNNEPLSLLKDTKSMELV
jgi:hypothetical protein